MNKASTALLACVLYCSSSLSILIGLPSTALASCCPAGTNTESSSEDCTNYCGNNPAANDCVGSYNSNENPSCVCSMASCTGPSPQSCVSNAEACSNYCSTLSNSGCYCQDSTFTEDSSCIIYP